MISVNSASGWLIRWGLVFSWKGRQSKPLSAKKIIRFPLLVGEPPFPLLPNLDVKYEEESTVPDVEMLPLVVERVIAPQFPQYS